MATTATTRSKAAAKSPAGPKLDASVFGVEPSDYTLLKEAYVAYLSNGRQNLAVTKTRAEVSGGGRKPWRQKGTGRARIGSIRAPHWRGGGVVHGPTGGENFTKHLNVKAKRQALRQALSLASKEGRIKVVDTFACKDGKVKNTLDLIKKTGAQGRILIAVSLKDDLVERATRNVTNVKALDVKYLNVFDVMNADTLVFSQKALDAVVAWLGTESSAAKKETK